MEHRVGIDAFKVKGIAAEAPPTRIFVADGAGVWPWGLGALKITSIAAEAPFTRIFVADGRGVWPWCLEDQGHRG
jgi:hypothetical protein